MAVCQSPRDVEATTTGCNEASSSAIAAKKLSGVTEEEPVGTGIFRHGGILPTAVCLSKAAIGAGILAMSLESAGVGLIYQIVGLVAGAVLTVVSIQMIAKASIDTGCWSYEDLCEELFHPAMSLFTGLINVCNCMGSGAGYLIVCGQIFQVSTGASAESRQLFICMVGIFVCGPLALAPHVSFMRYLAFASVTAMLLLVFTVVWYLGKHGVDETVTPQTLLFGPGEATIFTYMNAINTIVFAYNNQFNAPQLTGELTPQPSVRKMTKVAFVTASLCFVLFNCISIFGVLAFGVGDNQRDSIVVDLVPEGRNPFVLAALFAVMFSVLTCFQFHVFPIRQFAAYAVRKARGRGREEASDLQYGGRSLTRWLDIASALVSVAIIILVATVITSLSTILNFIGAFAAAYISYVVPPLWVIQVSRRQKDFSWIKPEVIVCLALFSLGVFFFVFGTYSAIRDAL